MLFGKIIPHNYQEKLIYGGSFLLSRLINRNKSIKDIPVQNILVVKLDEIGDLCYSLHVFDALKSKYPKAKITLLCKPFCRALVEAHPSIDFIIHDLKEFKSPCDLWLELRGNWKTLLEAFLNPPPIRLDRASIRLKNKKLGTHPHEIKTNAEIIAPLFDEEPKAFPRLYAAQAELQNCQEWLRSKGISKFILIHPGARKELRRWNPEKFASLSNWLFKQYGYSIVFTGDISEKNLIQHIIELSGIQAFSLAGEISLGGLIAFLSKAELYIGNESGPLCMAAVSHIPSMGLFGPGEPNVFYPPGEKSRYIHHVLECNPCDQINCKHLGNTCMDRITLLEAQEQIVSLMGESNEK
ncbi:MAG: glycosyltransferase family 9 protein [Bacteroidia bacterium]